MTPQQPSPKPTAEPEYNCPPIGRRQSEQLHQARAEQEARAILNQCGVYREYPCADKLLTQLTALIKERDAAEEKYKTLSESNLKNAAEAYKYFHEASNYRGFLYGCDKHRLWQGFGCIGCIEEKLTALIKERDEYRGNILFITGEWDKERDTLKRENEELVQLLREIKSDKPSAHSETVWLKLNQAVGKYSK